MSIRRPATLAEVAQWYLRDGEFDRHLKDFLHEFAISPRRWRLVEEPPLLADAAGDGGLRDSYLAATAAYLSRTHRQALPSWTAKPERFLKRPWFAGGSRELNFILLWESPPEFRERNLFVSENALEVA